MRTVFSSHNECAHIWASQSQYEGRASRVFFEGEIIYSYGRHFPVARFAPEYGDIVLFNDRGYSNSTAKHKSVIRAAIPAQYRVIYCDDPTRPVNHNLGIWEDKVNYLREKFAENTRKPTRARLALEIASFTNAARAYCDALKIDAPAFTCSTTDEDDAREYGAIAERKRNASREARRIKQDRIRKLEAAERFALWQAGENVYSGGFELYPTTLRIKGEQIETSRGAKIPVDDALKIYPLLERTKRGGGKLEGGLHNINLGSYRFNSFDGDTLIVGCHSIAWDQIEKMAIQLNLKGA